MYVVSRYTLMSYEWCVPAGYALAVALKILIPEHPRSKIAQLCLKEAELFERMVPCPHFEHSERSEPSAAPPASALSPSRLMSVDGGKTYVEREKIPASYDQRTCQEVYG